MMQNATDEQLLSNVWTLKYSPKTIDDLLLSEENRQFFSALTGLTNNLLFLGTPGQGKCLSGDELLDIYVPDKLYDSIVKFISGDVKE